MKRYSREEREWLVEEWGQSGKTKWAFAKELGLSVQTLNNRTRQEETGSRLVEVSEKLGAEGEPCGSGLREDLALSAREVVAELDGLRVRLPQGATLGELTLVFEALRHSHDR
jgi:transposase-like protein